MSSKMSTKRVFNTDSNENVKSLEEQEVIQGVKKKTNWLTDK